MRKTMKSILLFIFTALPLLTNAQDFIAEIKYLKVYIKTSECMFTRNGDTYIASQALEHIEKKHHFYKSDIKSAERFIEKAASKSTLSGKPYTVTCPAGYKQQVHGKPNLSSKVWLLRALNNYRNSLN
jgi:hypothetical protein